MNNCVQILYDSHLPIAENLIKGEEIRQIVLKRGVESFSWLQTGLFCNQFHGSPCNLLKAGWKPILGLP